MLMGFAINNSYKKRRALYKDILSLIPLSDYNPKHFSFRKLNFMSKGDTTSSGDKLSRLRIKDSKDRYLELSIFDFEKNIIGLLKELNKSASFIDFIIKSQLNHAVDYLNNSFRFKKWQTRIRINSIQKYM